MNSHLKKLHTDKRLAIMVLTRVPGKEYSLGEIAWFTGLTKERIRQIESEALKKCRKNGGWLWKEISCSKGLKLLMS